MADPLFVLLQIIFHPTKLLLGQFFGQRGGAADIGDVFGNAGKGFEPELYGAT